MNDKGTKALRAANVRITTLVWKLSKALENAKEQDISFTEVDAVSKLATYSFKLFLEYGESADKRSEPATRIKDVRQTLFCDDVKKRLNYEDDETHDCFERSPRKPRDFEEKYKKAKLENIHLQQKLDRVQKCIEDLECQSKCLISQVNLAEKEKSDVSRKDDMRYKHLESEVNRYKAEINDLLHRRKDNSLQTDLEYLKKTLRRTEVELNSVKDENTALRHANENKTKMIEEIQNRAEEEIKDATDAIVYYKEEQQRYKKAKDENNAKIATLMTERDVTNKNIAKLTTERDDANRRLAQLKTERDESRSDAAKLKVDKDELLNMIQKQKSSNNAGQHCEDALNKQLHEKDMECKQSENLVENLNRKLDEIQSQQKEFLKPRDREDLKWEENSNQKLIEENEGLRNTVFEMEQQLAGQNREDIDTEHQYRCDIDRYKQERNRANSKLNTLQEQMKNKMAKLKEALYYEDRKQLENRIQDLEDQISDRLGKPSIADEGYSKNCQQEQLDPVRDELSIMKTKLSSLEDELKINKTRKYVLEKENEEISKKYQDVLRKRRESESRYSSQSNIERENECLKHELTMSLMNIEKINQDYKDLEKRHDTEMTRNKETAHRLQNDLDRLKSQENLQKQTSRGELDSLKEQRTQLERDKGILRTKIYSLENEKIGLEERINKAELILPNQQTLREENSDLKESLETMKKAMENMEEKYKKQTTIRINTDGTTTKLKDENDRLRKERNRAKYDVDRISREKEELAHELQHEIDAAMVEHDNLKKDKNELTSIFQQKAKREKEKIDQLEKEREKIVARNISGEKTTQHNTHELLQLKNDYAVCKQQKALLEEDLSDQRQDITELEKRIKDLESKDQRCTKCDQYERTLAKLKKEIQELQDIDLESKNQRCTKCDQYERTLTKLRKENQELQDRYNIVTTELHNAEKKILNLEEENKEQKRQNRSQETSAATKDSGEVITLQRRINILQFDNANLTLICKHKDGLQEKSDKDLRHLKTVISNLQSDVVEHKQTNDTMSNILEILREEKLELEERMRRRSPQVVSDARNCQNCWKYRNEISDLKRDINHLRDRSQETSAASKDSGEVITLQRRINILQSDNADLTQKCKHKDGLQEKSDKYLRELKTVISKLQSDIVEHKQANDKMSNRLEVLREEKLELEERMRLSVAAEKPMEEQTPFVGNLCDINRPTALADKFSSLYTDEYTDAMEVIERSMDEASAVYVMLEWLKSCNDWCERLAREQIYLLTKESIGFMNKYHGEKIDCVIPDKCLILVKEFQRQIADNALASVRKICHVKSVKQKKLLHNSYIVKYIQRCSELCWRMQITNPPMCLKFDVKNGENLDKTLYNVYSKNGSRIEYLVWPILFLHKSGPLMAKGVAQGT